MKKYAFSLLLIIFSTTLFSQGNYWQDIEQTNYTLENKRSWLPLQYRIVHLNINELALLLKKAPLESNTPASQSSLNINLPLPGGEFYSFGIAESPVMEIGLADAFPTIKTYIGEGKVNNLYSVRFDITQFGFHAMIFTPKGICYIDPYTFGNIDEYIVYYKHDISGISPSMICETNNQILSLDSTELNSSRSIGGQIRTYRLALACTGEYALFYGGTKSGALAGMVTSVNRVNGIYEREVGIRFSLIPNDTLLIYLDSALDPYTNSSASTMLNENQATVSSVIGGSNYDIGHIFSTSSGGVASLGSVCRTNNKAKGVTGSSNPVNDPFDVDYVAHEIGHQFGGNHTFNANTGSCSGNRASTSAYEPGSGTTIMGYAGICGFTNDIQRNSDAFFHTHSFDEIITFSQQGLGSNCALLSSSANNPPAISTSGNYFIPFETPFKLTALASDPDGDTLTYCWEQMDLGPSGSWNLPVGDAPIFRSFSPDTLPTRYFPRLSSLINNTVVKGELLPSYGRTLHFRCTARDNRADGCGVTYNDTMTTVSVIDTVNPFAVLYPDSLRISWDAGSTQTILWDAAQTNLAPFNVPFVNIFLSLDNGLTFPIVIGSNVPNVGSYSFTVPNNLTTDARIWIESIGNIFFDVNNFKFSIVAPTAVDENDKETAVSIYPNPSKGVFNLTSSGLFGGEKLELKVYDNLGKVIIRSFSSPDKKTFTLDLTSEADGIYFMEIRTDKITVRKKIIKITN